ncbi:MAG: hypothetical protein O2819_00805 [Planctomycetota bacterium]|nr:hypothetical protein [Planctomycetota bacterium]MDA1105679.1 hypothetical protein [Planctomycetota bacterium]
MTELPSNRLLVGIARSEASFEQLVSILLDAGVPGATVIESRGLASILREELPIYSGLAALLPSATGSRVMLAVCSAHAAETAVRFAQQSPAEERPIIAVLLLTDAVVPGP